MDEELFARLREWRTGMASTSKVPPYVVFTDATLTALAERRPTTHEQLIEIAGIGPRKLGLYGDAVLALVAGARPVDVLSVPEEEAGQHGSATSS
jgi:DNA helicase-2/ATP-dependent DNA helicase PcrA